MMPNRTPEFIELGRTLRREGSDIEGVLARMRGLGASQMECVKAIRTIENMRLSDAARAVDFSETWADRRENNDRLRAAFFDAAASMPGAVVEYVDEE
jgi:hypothetical protein